jgi:hypothetical protein
MWRRHPDAVPGIDLAKTGLFAVDCDCKPSNGLAWLTAHAAQFGDPLDEPPAVDTPSGGRHLYYRNDFDPPHGNGRGGLPPKAECGIDIRGAGGYVVGPGSVFTDGSGSYYLHGSLLDAAPPPEWLRGLLHPPKLPVPVAFTVAAEPVSDVRLAAYGETALAQELADLAAAGEGERNNEANRIAFRVGQLVGSGCLTYSAAYAALEAAALSWGIRPGDRVLGPRGTISRGLKAGESQPRGPVDDVGPAVEILLDMAPEPVSAEDHELPEHLTRVPGLVGEITDFITATALYPQRGLSLGAALTLVGTAAGRHLGGPTRSGTHLYVICLAPSGAGKDHPLTMIAPIMDAAGLRAHVGPSQFISMPAVINFLCRVPLSVCAMDEFGSFLKRINSRRASGFEGAISGMLRTAWGCSFKGMATPEWAGRASEMICSPALSIFGAVTAGDFYGSLEGSDVTNGVLNRFLLIETAAEPDECVPTAEVDHIPLSISEGLKGIYGRNVLGQLCQSLKQPAYDLLTIGVDAEKVRRQLITEIKDRGRAKPEVSPFLARTAENAIRVATIAAIGQGHMEIGLETMIWARQLAMWSTETMIRGAGLYIADSENQSIVNAIKRALGGEGRVRRRDLLRKLAHKYKARDVEEVLKTLTIGTEEVMVEKDVRKNGGGSSYFYSMVK